MNDLPHAAPTTARRQHAELQRRRTFAIISHPDAGKTTLTEKLLLYAGAIQTAGMVRARKSSKATVSDWLDIERERGISVTSSAVQLPYKEHLLNILDTPGHDDFSEDTYRTLMAADSAVMVIDAGKGVETQTRKLFAVCRRRGIPIMTFINKMDLNALEPLDLLANLEEALGVRGTAMTWPVGGGKEFRGVVERSTNRMIMFEGQEGVARGSRRARARRVPLDSSEVEELLPADQLAEIRDGIELLDVGGHPFDREAFLGGELTPVFFGSALTNFGVEDFFDAFVQLAPPPSTRMANAWGDGGEVPVEAVGDGFSAFVFKIQANMNPKHRDSMAFLRVCSGVFERDMVVKHHPSGKEIRLARPYTTVARERATVDEAYPGDVIGIVNPGVFAIGDTVSVQGGFDFQPMPQMAPTFLARIRPLDVRGRKSFDKGLNQLVQEGTVQDLRVIVPREERVVGAVGRLQFEVLQHRLRQEYNVDTDVSVQPFTTSRWILGDPKEFSYPFATVAVDSRGRHLALFRSEFDMQHAQRTCPNVTLADVA